MGTDGYSGCLSPLSYGGENMIFSSQLKKLDGLSTEERLKTISNHLRKMQEELEYRLSVLDSSNISEIDADETSIYTGGEDIRNIITDTNGNVSSLAHTIDGLSVAVQNQANDIAAFEVKANAISGTVSNLQGDITNLQLEADNLSATVGNMATGLAKSLRLDANGLYITDQNGETVMIDGKQIVADTIKVSNLYGSYIYLKYLAGYDSSNQPIYGNAGQFTVTSAASASYAIDLTSYGSLRLIANNGDAFIGSSTGYVTLSGSSGNSSQGNFRPSANDAYTLGVPYFRWADIYAVNSEINTSDRELKTDITEGLDEYEELFKRLQPVSYRFKDGTSGRRHTGFISQDVEKSLADSGLTSLDFAGFVKSPRVDEDGNEIEGEYEYALRYGEFIALNTHMIQKLMGRVEELERRVSELEHKEG